MVSTEHRGGPRLKLQMITAALPPQLDGIGDYSACLGSELSRRIDLTILTSRDHRHSPIDGVAIEPAFSVAQPRSVWEIVPRVAGNKPDWLLLQYNPFSYGRLGFNPHLPLAIRAAQRRCPGLRFAL